MKTQAFLTTSWDDGYPSDARIAELLARYGLKGTFYIPLESQRSVMDRSGIREIGSLFEVGGHTIHHADLSKLTDAKAREEISGCKGMLEEITGKPCKTFCFPRGRHGVRHFRMVQQSGFIGVRTVEMMSLAMPRVHDGLAVLPTTLQAQNHSGFTYLKNIGKRFAFNNMGHFVQCVGRFHWVKCAERLLEQLNQHGGVFHLWGHSWELDADNRWSELEAVLRLMAATNGSAESVTNAEVCERILGMGVG